MGVSEFLRIHRAHELFSQEPKEHVLAVSAIVRIFPSDDPDIVVIETATEQWKYQGTYDSVLRALRSEDRLAVVPATPAKEQ